MPLLYVDSYKKTYYSNVFSLSSCITFILFLFVLLISLFAGYASEDFWKTITTYYEQPIVTDTKNFLIYTTEVKKVKEVNRNKIYTYFYSSSNVLNGNFPENNNNMYLLSSPSVSIGFYDDDNDGRNDRIKGEITFSTGNQGEDNDPSTLMNIKLLLFFNYALKDKAKFIMNTMIPIDIDCPNGAMEISTKGDLLFYQKSPIASTSIPNKKYYVDDTEENGYVFDTDLFSPYDYMEIYNKYSNRNFTTKYDYTEFVLPGQSTSNRLVTIKIDIQIPKLQKILFYQSVYLSLKEAWIQYIYIFIPIFICVFYLLLFILENQVFPCSVKSDLVRL